MDRKSYFLNRSIVVLLFFWLGLTYAQMGSVDQPLSLIGIHKVTFGLHESASVLANPFTLGLQVTYSCLFLLTLTFYFHDI